MKTVTKYSFGVLVGFAILAIIAVGIVDAQKRRIPSESTYREIRIARVYLEPNALGLIIVSVLAEDPATGTYEPLVVNGKMAFLMTARDKTECTVSVQNNSYIIKVPESGPEDCQTPKTRPPA